MAVIAGIYEPLEVAMTCPQCAQPTLPGARFCTSCGTRLPEVSRCDSCGGDLPPNARFCVGCGAPVEAAPVGVRYVPAKGMSTWATPDPSTAAVARLPGGTPLQVVTQRGAWAQVQASNGWTGWVDARRLTDTPGAVAPAAVGAAAAFPWRRHLGVAGAAVALLGALLPWITLEGPGFSESRNSFDVPALFLVDFQTDAGTGFSIGIMATVLAVATAGLTFVAAPWAKHAARSVAAALAGVGVVGIIQLARLVSDSSLSLGDVLGYGPLVTILGGIAASFARTA